MTDATRIGPESQITVDAGKGDSINVYAMWCRQPNGDLSLLYRWTDHPKWKHLFPPLCTEWTWMPSRNSLSPAVQEST